MTFVFLSIFLFVFTAFASEPSDGKCFGAYSEQLGYSLKHFEAVKSSCLVGQDLKNAELLIEELEQDFKTFDLKNLTHHYEKLQEYLSFCRTKQILAASDDSSLGDSLFLHVLGDIFGESSGLEGNSQSVTIPYRTKMLEQIQKALENQTFIANKAQIDPCGLAANSKLSPDIPYDLLRKVIDQYKNAEALMQEFSAGDLGKTRVLLREQLSALEVGDALFLPAGWTKHAVLYQITKDPGQNYTLKIFNSGEGIGTYHLSIENAFKTQFFPFAGISEIHLDKITSFVFLKALQEIATPGVYNSKPEDFYGKLLVALDGKPDQTQYDASILKDPQLSGTCTYFPTTWLLSSTVDPKIAAQIEFLTGLKTLQSFSNQKRDWNENSLSLLRKGLVFFSESAARDYLSGIIDEGSLTAVSDEGQRIKSDVILFTEKKLEEQHTKDALRFTASNLQPISKLETITIPRIFEIKSNSSEIKVELPEFDLDADLSALYTDLYHAVFKANFANLYYNCRKNLDSDYRVIESNCNQFWDYDNTHAEVILNVIETLALNLSLEPSFWRGKNPEKTLKALADISKLYLFILVKKESSQIDPIGYLTALKFLTVADLINQNFITDITPQIPSMYQPRAGLILSGTTSVFEVSDPRWQYQMELMREYYEPQKDQMESFFGFEKYPAGTTGEARNFFDDPQAESSTYNRNFQQPWGIKFQYDWPDFKWAKRWLEKNTVYQKSFSEKVWNYLSYEEKIASFKYTCSSSSCLAPPNVSRETESIWYNRQAILSLTGQKEHALPEAFYQLQTLSVITDFLLTSPFVSSAPWDFDKGIQLFARVHIEGVSLPSRTSFCTCGGKSEPAVEETLFNQYQLSYHIFGAAFKNTGQLYVNPHKHYPRGAYSSPWDILQKSNRPFIKFENIEGHYTELLQIWSLAENGAIELLNSEISPIRYRVAPNEYILKQPPEKLNLERFRNLMGLSTEPELQLKSTLDFFTKYPELFILPEYQVLFEKLMMEPALMLDQLRISPQDSEKLVSSLRIFCDTKLESFRKYDDIKSMAFILHMKQLFYEQVLFAKTLPHHKIAHDLEFQLSGAPEELFKIIQTLDANQATQKSFLYRNLAEMYLYSPMLSERDIELLILASIELKLEVLEDKSYQDSFSERAITNLLVKQNSNIQRVLENFNTRSQILDFVIKILKPNAFRNSSAWKQNGALYTAQFGDVQFQIDILNGRFYDGGNNLISFPRHLGQNIQQYFQEKLPSRVTQIDLSNYEWEFANGQKAKFVQAQAWRRNYLQLQIGGFWYQWVDLFVLPRTVTRDYNAWHSFDTGLIKFINQKTGRTDYELKVDFYDTNDYSERFKLGTFTRLSDGAIRIDVDENSSYRVFSQIENWNEVYVWQNPNTQAIIEVNIPRLGLTFKPDNDGMNCAEHTDYKIAKLQYVPELGIPITYLVCESKKNLDKKLVLMPLDEPMSRGETLKTSFGVYHDANHIITYDVDPVLGLSRNNEESRYYLALRKLFKHQYREAAEEIRKTSIELKPLEGEERKVLEWLMDGDKYDHDPRSYAVRLLAAYWELKQRQYWEGKFDLRFKIVWGEDKKHNELLELYKRYQKLSEHVDTNILGVLEEEELAHVLGIKTRLAHRQNSEIPKYFDTVRRVDTPADSELADFRKFFVNSFRSPPLSLFSALDPMNMITVDTFPLLYQIASGESFDRNNAIQLLKQLLNSPDVSLLTNEQIRAEFITLFHLASHNSKDIGDDPLHADRWHARFLEAVVKAKNDGVTLKTLSEIKDDEDPITFFRNLLIYDRNNQSSWPHPSILPDSQKPPITPDKQPIIPAASADVIAADLPLALLAQEDPLRRPIFNAIELSQIIQIKNVKMNNSVSGLENILNKSQNKAVQALKQKIAQQATKIEKSKKHYSDPDWNRFKAPDVTQQKQELLRLKTEILEAGQRYAPTFKGGAFNRVLHLADVGKSPQLDDLIYLLLKRSMVSLYQTQGALQLPELNTLYQNLVRYLMLSTYVNHVEDFSEAIQIAQKSCGYLESHDCQVKLGKAVSLAMATRNYQIAQHIEYLVFEYFMKILIRAEQVAALDKLEIKQGQVHDQKALGGLLELIMAFGKTSVLLPLLSMLDNSGQWLNMIVLPEALIASMSKDLSKQLSSAFSRGVMVMHVSRQRYLKTHDLDLLYKRLVRAREQSQTVVTTNSSIQSLFLSFIDRLACLSPDPDIDSDLPRYKNIFRFLRQYGRLTIDEVDLALDILQAHQFSVGKQEPLVNSPILKTIPIVAFSLYREIAVNPQLYQTLDFPFLPVRGRVAITPGTYHDFKPQLIDAILKPQFLKVSGELSGIYHSFVQSEQHRALAKDYLLSNSDTKRRALFNQISDSKLKDVFAVLYDEINYVFPLTAVRKIGVHYGPLTGQAIAIPYHSGEPMVNSRFGTALESLNYTLQLALYERGYKESVASEIELLQRMFRAHRSGSIGYKKRVEALVGPEGRLDIMRVTQSEIDSITHRLKNPEHIVQQLDLDWSYVVPQVKFNRKQLHTNAQIYQSLFAFIQGFSGTLWSAQTFPKIFQNPLYSDTAEKTFLVLWLDYLENPKPVLQLPETHILSTLYDNDFKGSLMDEAGIFRAFSNFKIAQEIYAHTGKQVAYYDEKNNLLSCCGYQKQGEWVAFWDKKHTTGSDIKLSPDMTAAMTIDFHLTSRNFQQTVWRLRGLGTGQKIAFYTAMPEDLSVIQEKLRKEWKIEPAEPFALGDLILYSVLNEDTKLDELKFRALKQKMKSVIIGEFLNQIFDQSATPDQMLMTYKIARSLFEVETGNVPLYKSMGMPTYLEETKKAVIDVEKQILEAPYLKTLYSENLFFKTLNKGSIETEIRKLIQLEQGSLPVHVQYPNKELETEVEIETEQEQQKETEEETETETEKEDLSAFKAIKPHLVVSWNLGFQTFDPNQQPVSQINKILKFHDFSPNIWVSLNFAPKGFEFFGPYHKNSNDVLLIQDKQTNQFQVVIIDENDAKEWNAFLKTFYDTQGPSKIGLYNLSTDHIYRESQDAIDKNEIPLDLLVQVGFLAGRVNYPKYQLPALKMFLGDAPRARQLLNLFKKDILKYKRDTQKAFPESDLYDAFIEILDHID